MIEIYITVTHWKINIYYRTDY